MKKGIYAGAVIFSLITIIFFGVIAGKRIYSLVGGPSAADGQSFEQTEGEYIAYDVAYPVASFVEEYYSGDPDRARKIAYLTFDEERQAVLKVVVSDSKKSRFDHLMRAVNRTPELKESWGDRQANEERPIVVKGSLLPIVDSDDIREMEAALAGPDSASSKEIHAAAMAQAEWYMIEDNSIEGISVANLWICAVAIGINILIFLISLLLMISKKDSAGENSYSSEVDRFFARQKSWLDPWCAQGRLRRMQSIVVSLLVCVAALVGIGIMVDYPLSYVLTCHLPMGVCMGEAAVGFSLLMGFAFNPDKIIGNYRKALERTLPSPEERERMARELLATESQWSVLEKGKNRFTYGLAGENYWLIFSESGRLAVVDSRRIEKIQSEEVSGQVWSGKVRMNYVHYDIQVAYRNFPGEKRNNVCFSFNAESAAGHFMSLIRQRLGERAAGIIQ